jgi:hypothetical protein
MANDNPNDSPLEKVFYAAIPLLFLALVVVWLWLVWE